MAKKKLYRTFITLEVLSETEIPSGISLAEIANECDTGEYSGICSYDVVNEQISGLDAVKKVNDSGSDLSFFNMDENGNDLDYTPIEGSFVSVWEDGTEIQTDATLGEETGYVDAENSDDDSDHGSLVREFFIDVDENEYEVCPECHEYIKINGKCPNCE